MAPSCVMLDTDVRLVASTGEKTCGGGTMSSLLKPRKMAESWGPPMSFVDRLRWLEEGGGGSGSSKEKEEEPKDIADWVREGTIRVIADNLVAPPEISTLSLYLPAAPREIVAQLEDVCVKSADKGLLVISTGPPSHYYDSSGCYLVYDAAADALFLAPPIDCFDSSEVFGCRPVVMRCGQATGDFILALVTMSISTRQYYLLTWSPASSSTSNQQWMCRDVCLPDDVVQYAFMTDVAFAFGGRMACWVDLYLGVLTCDVLSADPEFQLKLLPEDYVMDYGRMARGRPDGHSTMGCGVDGEIKFVYMDGFVEDEVPKELITITTWTLVGQVQVPGLCTWVRDDHSTLCCRDLWADESFLAIPGLPKQPPTLPILSPNEADVVYFFSSDIGKVDGHVKTKGEYVLGLNLLTKKVHTWSKCPPGRSLQLVPSFITTELCPSQKSSYLDGQAASTTMHD